jgi:hypothetical protein
MNILACVANVLEFVLFAWWLHVSNYSHRCIVSVNLQEIAYEATDNAVHCSGLSLVVLIRSYKARPYTYIGAEISTQISMCSKIILIHKIILIMYNFLGGGGCPPPHMRTALFQSPYKTLSEIWTNLVIFCMPPFLWYFEISILEIYKTKIGAIGGHVGGTHSQWYNICWWYSFVSVPSIWPPMTSTAK